MRQITKQEVVTVRIVKMTASFACWLSRRRTVEIAGVESLGALLPPPALVERPTILTSASPKC